MVIVFCHLLLRCCQLHFVIRFNLFRVAHGVGANLFLPPNPLCPALGRRGAVGGQRGDGVRPGAGLPVRGLHDRLHVHQQPGPRHHREARPGASPPPNAVTLTQSHTQSQTPPHTQSQTPPHAQSQTPPHTRSRTPSQARFHGAKSGQGHPGWVAPAVLGQVRPANHAGRRRSTRRRPRPPPSASSPSSAVLPSGMPPG